MDFQADKHKSTCLFFDFCLSIRDISDQIYQSGHQEIFLNAYMQILNPRKQETDIITYYKQNASAYALYGIVNAWVLRGYQETPEQMVAILYNVQENEIFDKSDANCGGGGQDGRSI